MRYGNIKFLDIADGIGIRTSIFVSGCTNHCDGCMQPETWDFDYGIEYTNQTEKEILDSINKPYVKGLTLLGGEPFEPDNQRGLLNIVRRVKEELHGKDVWAYTGFLLEDLLCGEKHCEVTDELLSYIDVIVDGKFDKNLADVGLAFRGSSNQRIIDMNVFRKTKLIDKSIKHIGGQHHV